MSEVQLRLLAKEEKARQRLARQEKCDAFNNAGLPCARRANLIRFGHQVCTYHYGGAVRFAANGPWLTGGNIFVYVMATAKILKVGKSTTPHRRLVDVRRGSAPPEEEHDLSTLDVVATRHEFPPTFTEGVVHTALGYRDRVGKEWWLRVPRVESVLAKFGLTLNSAGVHDA